MSIVVPAVLPASHKEFEERLALFARLPSVDRVQIDVVDGRFAKPASWPYSNSTDSPHAAPIEFKLMAQRGEMLPALERITYEIDLMCFDAETVAEAWLALGATRLTFHVESTTDLPRLLESSLTRYGAVVSCGIALNLASELALIESVLANIDYVQFMGIAEIGKQGQPFDSRVFEKVLIFHKRHPEVPIQIDGGVSLGNAKKLLALGASSLVVGSALLRASNPAVEIETFEALKSQYGV